MYFEAEGNVLILRDNLYGARHECRSAEIARKRATEANAKLALTSLLRLEEALARVDIPSIQERLPQIRELRDLLESEVTKLVLDRD